MKKCRQLVKVGGQFFCRIYPNRLGYKIAELRDGTVLYCNLIKNAPTDYAECPYNTGKRPLLDLRGAIASSTHLYQEGTTGRDALAPDQDSGPGKPEG